MVGDGDLHEKLHALNHRKVHVFDVLFIFPQIIIKQFNYTPKN